MRHGWVCVVAASLWLLLDVASSAAAERVALVIGNSAYQRVAPLKNPRNDAEAMASELEALGFEVVKGFDLDAPAFRDTVRAFMQKLEGADTALFFYAGHGLQVNGINYLAPTDSRLSDESDLEFEALRLEFILGPMEKKAKTSIVFLDACRDNPLVENLARSMGTRSAALGRGLARVESGIGSFVGFSTQPGNVALDGEGKHSPFTLALLDHLETPGMEIEAMMRKVRDEVVAATDGRQVPWSNSSLLGRGFMFREPAPEPVVANLPSADPSFELEYWSSVKDGRDPALMQSYLDKYPNGQFSGLAQLMIERIRTEEQRATATVPESQQLARLAPQDEIPTESNKAGETVSPDIIVLIQKELERVGCDPGGADGIWGAGSRRALERFSRDGKVALATLQPSTELFELLENFQGRVCSSPSKPTSAAKPSAAPAASKKAKKTPPVSRQSPAAPRTAQQQGTSEATGTDSASRAAKCYGTGHTEVGLKRKC